MVSFELEIMSNSLQSNISRNTSLRMAKVKQKNTTPELAVRRLIYKMGHRYHLHQKDLPGKPDLVFHNLQKIIFVHGCFWHAHDCKAGQNKPLSNKDYWEDKFNRNRDRDAKNCALLEADGWNILIIWECEIKKDSLLAERIKTFLKG